MSPLLESLIWRRMLPFLCLVIVLLLILFGWGAFTFLDNKQESAELQEQITTLSNTVTLQDKLLKIRQDSLGRLTHTIKVIEVDREAAQYSAKQKDSFIATTLRALSASVKELKEAQKNTRQVMNWKIESNADVLTVLKDTVLEGRYLKNIRDSVRIDTLKYFAKSFSYQEPASWFRISGLVTQDSITIRLREWKEDLVKADLLLRPDRPKLIPRFLRRRRLVTKIKSNNPYSSLKDFTQIDVKPK